MSQQINFTQVSNTSVLIDLIHQCQQQLTAAQDGMWETFTNQAVHWSISNNDNRIGYACVNEDNRLLQFFILPQWLPEGVSIMQEFIQHHNITHAVIGTNNPTFLSLAMHLQKSVSADTYLFEDFLATTTKETFGAIRLVDLEEQEKVVDFFHKSTGAPKAWLNDYTNKLITKKEIYILEDGDDVLGTCEVRTSESTPNIADIGMVVAPAHRKKGIGSYLLGSAKAIAIRQKKQPICSCEKENLGSLKSIRKNGFRSIHQMLVLSF